jgi:hypothetical protein
VTAGQEAVALVVVGLGILGSRELLALALIASCFEEPFVGEHPSAFLLFLPWAFLFHPDSSFHLSFVLPWIKICFTMFCETPIGIWPPLLMLLFC